MATYMLHEKSYLPTDGGIPMIFEAGSTVSVPDDLLPGPHMEPMDAKAKSQFLKVFDRKSGKYQPPAMNKVEDMPMATFAGFDMSKMLEETSNAR